jgi:hypothetical protein
VTMPLAGGVATDEVRERVSRQGKDPAATSPPRAPAKTHRTQPLRLTARHSDIRAGYMCPPLLLDLVGVLESGDSLEP